MNIDKLKAQLEQHKQAHVRLVLSVSSAATKMDVLNLIEKIHVESVRVQTLSTYISTLGGNGGGGGEDQDPPPEPSPTSGKKRQKELTYGDLHSGDYFAFQRDPNVTEEGTLYPSAIYYMKNNVVVLVYSSSMPGSVGNIEKVEAFDFDEPVILVDDPSFLPKSPYPTRDFDNNKFNFNP